MSWFGEGLSTLKGQLQNFTKEVLSDAGEENSGDRSTDLLEAKRKCEKLESLCEAQNLEISALRKQISQLQKVPPDGSSEVANDGHNETWWTIEHRSDPRYSNGTKEASLAVSGGRSDLRTHSLEKKLEEKDDIINKLKGRLLQLQNENEKVHDLEKQIEQLHLEKSSNHSETQTGIDNLSTNSQPDIIHSTIGALEQENKILKQQIMELELLTATADVGKEGIKLVESDKNKEDPSGMVSCAYLKSELETMEKVIQDLESQLAELKAENESLNMGMDELDKQHQAAIDQLLHAKSTLQKQNEKLESEIHHLKIMTDEQMSLNDELQSLVKENNTLKEELKAIKESSSELMNAANKNHYSNTEEYFDALDNFKSELKEKFMNVITCEIPKDFFSNKVDTDIINIVEALNKMCADYKWKKETLERKVVEMMKEITVSKQNLTEHEETIALLENECKILRSNVESLVEELLIFKNGTDEVLAPIPENSEETEALEQKVTALENEVDVLREARTNLEADAVKLREHESMLLKQLHSAEAALRNRENIHREISEWQETADNANSKLRELMESKLELEAEVRKLRIHEDSLKELQHKNETLYNELCSVRKEKLILTEKLAECENFKSQLETKISFLDGRISEVDKLLSDKAAMFAEMHEQMKITEQKLLSAENNQTSMKNENEHLNKIVAQKNEEIYILKNDLKEMHNLSERMEDMKTDYVNLQANFKCREDELDNTRNQIAISEKLNKLLHRKVNVEYIDLELLVKNELALQKKLTEIENCGVEEKTYINQIKSELESKEQKLVNLDQEITTLRQQKEKWKNDVETIYELREDCKKFQSQMNIKDEEISTVKQMLAASECINAVLHRKLNINYEGIEALQWESSYIQQHINEIQNTTVRDENCIKNLMCELQHKDNQIQEFKAQNQSLEEKITNLQEKYECLSMENVQNSEKEEKLILLLSQKDKELTQKQHEILELQLVCQKLYDAEVALFEANKEITYWKTEFAAAQEKLQEEVKHKNDLISTLDKLKEEFTSKKFQELELKDLQESVVTLKTKYDELYSSKLKLEEDLQKYKDSNIQGMELRNSDTNLSSGLLKENVCSETESNKLAALTDSEKSFIPNLSDGNNDSKSLINLQNEEVVAMAKETIANLSKIIKNKDTEISDLKERNKNTLAHSENFQQKISQLEFEKDELVKTIHIKHQENIQYHKEIQRLSGLLNQELQKSQEIQQQHKGLLKQHEDKQKLLINTQNEVISLKQRLERLEASYISQSSNAEIEGSVPIREGNHTDELKSVIASKDQIIEKMLSKLSSYEQELKFKQQEINVLRELSQSNPNALLPENSNSQGYSSEDYLNQLPQNMKGSQNVMDLSCENNYLKEQVKQLEQECHRLTECLQEQQTKTKYLEDDLLERKERESSLEKELERLREHLVTVEDSYTQEMLRTEQQAHSLQARLNEAEERLKSSSTAYTSASILVNQQVEALQNQSHSLTQQRDEAFSKLSAAEDKVQKHEAALRNLQAVLEQFQRDKEREISAEIMKVQKQLQASEKKQENLIEEIQALKTQLGKANEGLSAAARLGEEIDRKTETIASLKEKVTELTEKLDKSEQLAQFQAASENKVDRNLMKNLIVGYFSAPAVGRTQVLHVLASVLEMCPDELTKLGIGSTSPASNQSLSEAFIRFLEDESRPQPKLRLLPQAQENTRDRSSPTPSTSSTGSRRSPLLLSEVQLPTFTQFPAVRSSSSILKDVLKES